MMIKKNGRAIRTLPYFERKKKEYNRHINKFAYFDTFSNVVLRYIKMKRVYLREREKNTLKRTFHQVRRKNSFFFVILFR